MWIQAGRELEDLQQERTCVIGARCVGSWCLAQKPMPADSEGVARQLVDAEQYLLANQIFSRLREAGTISTAGILNYATSYSESNPDLAGAERALGIVQAAMKAVRDRAATVPGAEEPVLDLAACHRRVAGLLHWKWQLSQSPADLEAAIASYEPALSYTEKARAAGTFRHPGFLAQTRLKLMLLLRFRDDNPDRPDVEGHREAILSIAPLETDDLLGVSYLTWYQAITLADAGRGQSSQQLAIEALAADAMLRPDTRYWEVGRRQYRTMRRFLEQNSRVFRNRSLIGTIAQFLLRGQQAAGTH